MENDENEEKEEKEEAIYQALVEDMDEKEHEMGDVEEQFERYETKSVRE